MMEDYCVLPFVTVSNERMTNMNIGEVIEELILIKKTYDIRYPYGEAIDNACNILKRLPRTKNVYEWVKEHENI
jgi:hypothetical protein